MAAIKNVIVCKNCKSENPFYTLICHSCKSYLRERIYNIDLWKTLAQLIENPSYAFRSIIFSEHKNFLMLIILLISGKLFIDGMFFSMVSLKDYSSFSNVFFNYIIIAVSISFLISVFAFALIKAIKKIGIVTRFADNFSIIAYSFIPHAFGFILLFPTELILFGSYLFSTDPSPFIIKETLAYVMLGFEMLVVIWSIFLTFIGLKIQTNNILFAIILTIIIHGILFTSVWFISVNVFR
jgi:hypothetical protein